MTRVLGTIAAAGVLASGVLRAQDGGTGGTSRYDGALSSASAQVQNQDRRNQGEDDTRPLTRFDLKYQYQNLGGLENDNAHIVTLRVDKPFALSRDWQVASRVDLPTYISDAVGSDNPGGDTHIGLGDMVVQALLVHSPPPSRVGWVAGARLVLPTASEDRMGFGKWRVVSTAGVRYFVPEMSEGSWIGFQLRYDVDFAGDPDRRHVSELQLGPQLYVQLPNAWFVNFYPATDIRYNFSDPLTPEDTGRWFAPIDVAVGRMLRESTIASLEIGIPIGKQYVFYDFKVEARVGFFF